MSTPRPATRLSRPAASGRATQRGAPAHTQSPPVVPGAGRRDVPVQPDGPQPHVRPAGADRLPASAAVLERLRRVASGEEDADLVVRGGLVVVVHDGTVVNRDILIVGRYIAAVTRPGALSGRRSLDAAGRYVLPAYVDAGLRIEDTLVSPGELARLIVPRGTGTLLADPTALIALGGVRAPEFAAGSATPLRVLIRPGGEQPAGAAADEALLSGPASASAVPGGVPPAPPALTPLVEIGPPLPGTGTGPGTGAGAAGLSALETGPAAGLRWALDAPARTGIRTVTELAFQGHLDHDVRLAVGRGASPIDTVRRATLLPARMYGLDSVLGSIAPARLADLQVVSSLADSAPPDVVVVGGRIAAEHGRPLFDNLDPAPSWAVGCIRLPANLHAGSFTCPDPGRAGRRDGSIAAVSIDPAVGSVSPPVGSGSGAGSAPLAARVAPATEATAGRHGIRTVRVQPTVRDGRAVADPTRDLQKIAVFGRAGEAGPGEAGPVEVGLLRGCGLSRGALGFTTAQAPGQVVVVGTRDDDMLTAAKAVEGMGGGFVVVDQGWVRAACPLPLLGLMSDAPWEAVLGELAAVDTAAADLGCRLSFPLRTLSCLGRLLYTRP
jgi:adenine deaminase